MGPIGYTSNYPFYQKTKTSIVNKPNAHTHTQSKSNNYKSNEPIATKAVILKVSALYTSISRLNFKKKSKLTSTHGSRPTSSKVTLSLLHIQFITKNILFWT